jgi:protein suppressor of PHYA-105 1
MGDDATPLGAMEGARLQSKESEYSLKPEGRNMLESQEMFIPGEGDFNQSPPQEFAVQEGKNVNRSINHGNGLEQPHASLCSMDDAGIMVDELRVTDYNGSNLAAVGTSSNRERMQARQNQWQHLYQLAGGSGGGSSRGDTLWRGNGQAMPSFWEDMGGTHFPELLAQKPFSNDSKDMAEQLMTAENQEAPGNNCGGIRTKIISKSGFSEFFVKKTLKGKGIVCKGPPSDGFHVGPRDQNNLKIGGSTMVASDVSQGLGSKTATPSPEGIAGLRPPGGSDHDGVCLRQWLKVGRHKASKVKCLYIFRQIVDVVDFNHSQGVALKDLRPSCFRLLLSNQVKYIGSSVKRETLNGVGGHNTLRSDNCLIRKRPLEQVMFPSAALYAKKQKFSENANFSRRWHHFPSRSCHKLESAWDSCDEYNEANPSTECESQSKPSSPCASTIAQHQLTSLSERLEEKWYRSPEELTEGASTSSSNIYCLGVLIFEVRCCFSIYHLKFSRGLLYLLLLLSVSQTFLSLYIYFFGRTFLSLLVLNIVTTRDNYISENICPYMPWCLILLTLASVISM